LVVDGQLAGIAIRMAPTQTTPSFTQAQFTIDESGPGSSFQVRVWASGANYLPSPATTSTDKISRLSQPLLQTPVGSELSFADQEIGIALQANVIGALAYNIQFLNPANNQQVGLLINIGVTNLTTVKVPIGDLPTGSYKIKIQAVGTPNTIPSYWTTSSASVFVVGLIALDSLRYTGGQVVAAWTGNDAAQGYDFELRNGLTPVLAGGVLRPNEQTPAPTQIKIDVPAMLLGAEYTGYLRVTANGLTGPWSTGVSLVLLDVPQQLALSYTGTQLHASWQSVDKATGYTVELHGATPDQTRSASTPVGQVPLDTTLPVDVQGLPSNIAYTGIVKATVGQLASEWSSPPVSVALLPAPVITTISYKENMITVVWSVVQDAERYHVQLVNGTDLLHLLIR
jgi:hypothetical protein